MNQKNEVSYPMQFAILIGSMGGLLIVAALILAVLGSVMLNVPLDKVTDALSDPANADTARLLNTLAAVISFFLPAFILARVISRQPFKHLGFNRTININQVMWILLITVAAMVLSGALGELNEKIPLPDKLYAKAKEIEELYKKGIMAMAAMDSPLDYIISLIVIALAPAIFEEVLFRGALQQVMIGWTRSKWAGIIITSILFSAIHFSYFGFLSRTALGIVLGLIFYSSRNLWLNILLHFLNNAFVVTQLYILFRQGKPIEKTLDESVPVWWGAIAIVILVIAFRAFQQQSAKVLAEKERAVLSSPENMLS